MWYLVEEVFQFPSLAGETVHSVHYEHVLRGSRLTAPICGEQAPAAVSGTGDHRAGQIFGAYERLRYSLSLRV